MSLQGRTLRADYEVICRFSTARMVGPLKPLVVQGSTVCLRNGNMYLCESVCGLPVAQW